MTKTTEGKCLACGADAEPEQRWCSDCHPLEKEAPPAKDCCPEAGTDTCCKAPPSGKDHCGCKGDPDCVCACHEAGFASLAPPATERTEAKTCATCSDTHWMTLEDRDVMCTFCPSPCKKCRQSWGAYCEKTPCVCPCHVKAAPPERPRMTEERQRCACGQYANHLGMESRHSRGSCSSTPDRTDFDNDEARVATNRAELIGDLLKRTEERDAALAEVERLKVCDSVKHHDEHHAKEAEWKAKHAETVREVAALKKELEVYRDDLCPPKRSTLRGPRVRRRVAREGGGDQQHPAGCGGRVGTPRFRS